VLVSEVMLQQTQAGRVIPAYRAFLERFPTVAQLAAAPRSEVLRRWGALGYNRRAVNLSEAARAIVGDHGGRVPDRPDVLVTLAGVGPYTASAVASIAFGRPVAALDTNARRVTARVLFGVDWQEVPPAELRNAATGWVDREDPGSWNQAVMDLGREICRPAPRCDVCPVARWCRYREAGTRQPARRRPRRRPAPPFEGSGRQVRGAIVRILRAGPATLDELVEAAGTDARRTLEALAALHREGIVTASGAALSGAPRGRVRLAE